MSDSNQPTDFPQVTDLRSALDVLRQYDNEVIETDTEVDPIAELSGVYRYVGAHGTVKRPTQRGPAMIFNKVKGYDDMRVLIGLLSSRQRVARMFNTTSENITNYFREAVNHPINPIVVGKEKAVC